MADETSANEGLDRRQFLHTAAAGALVGIARQSGVAPPTTRRRGAPASALSPDAAVQELLAGNRRFAANQLTSIEHDLEILKAHTVDKQEPFAAVLACA